MLGCIEIRECPAAVNPSGNSTPAPRQPQPTSSAETTPPAQSVAAEPDPNDNFHDLTGYFRTFANGPRDLETL